MKIRNGFVSNSSSSSFILYIKDLDDEVLESIYDYASGSKNNLEYDAWSCYKNESGDYLCCSAWLDNIDLDMYVKDTLCLGYRIIYEDDFLPDVEDYINRYPYRDSGLHTKTTTDDKDEFSKVVQRCREDKEFARKLIEEILDILKD